MKEIIEKYKNDKILNFCENIKQAINKVMEEENGCNEGCLEIYYEYIMEHINYIEEERMIYLHFWGDDND